MGPARRRFIPALAGALLLAAAGAAMENAQPRPGPGPASTRLTVILVGGLSWDRVTPLRAAGRLPSLDHLLSRGGTAGDIVAKEFPTRTSILASLIIGRWPWRHRIREPQDLAGEETVGRARTPVWRLLAERGQGCDVAGLPLDFPREHPANRVIPAGPGDSSRVPPATVDRVTGGRDLTADQATVLRSCLAADLEAVETVRHLGSGNGRRARHLFLRLPGLDRWEDDLQARQDRLPEAQRTILAEGYYRFLDELLGEVLAWRGAEGSLFLVSEQGNREGRPSQRRDFPSLERYPAFGFLWATGPGIRQGILPVTLSPPDLVPTWLYLTGTPLPNSLDGRVAFDLLEEDYYFKHRLSFR